MQYLTLALALAAATVAVPVNVNLAPRAPPNVPTAAAAKTALAALTVAAQGPQTGYSRDLFPHWITQSGYVSILYASRFPIILQ